MKKLFMLLAALLPVLVAYAQQERNFDRNAQVPATGLQVTDHKTTLLIFPAAIQAADRGDSYVLAEKVKGVENVLKVKAGQKDFTPSNLHVITADGTVYDFNVSYQEVPPYQTIDLRKQPPYAAAVFKGVSLNGKQIEEYARSIAGSKPFLFGVHDRSHGMRLTVDGIYISDDVLFFRLLVKNSTAIPFSEGSLRFFIRDRKKAKRTSVQDNEVVPLYVDHAGSPEDERGQTIVIAFPRFTIADSKHFVIELAEQNGDRNTSCKLDEDKLLKARPLHR